MDTSSATAPAVAHCAPGPLYGCMGLGGPWDADGYGPEQIAQAEAAVAAALEIGITVFDHADIYGQGKSEAVFGDVLARDPGLRGRIQIQTKCGIIIGGPGRPGRYDFSPAHIFASVAGSLERLGVDRVDTLLLHRPDPLADPQAVAAVFADLVAQGMVGQFGVSNCSHQQIAYLQSHLDVPLVANQLEMSLHRRDWVEAGVLVNTTAGAANGFPLGTLEYCQSHGIELQAWGALAQGRYSGAPRDDSDRATAAAVQELADLHGTTPETIVLWWLQRHPAGIAPVIGTTDPGRIRACRDAVRGPVGLTAEQWYQLWVAARGEPLP